jgi:hypothetical protein
VPEELAEEQEELEVEAVVPELGVMEESVEVVEHPCNECLL